MKTIYIYIYIYININNFLTYSLEVFAIYLSLFPSPFTVNCKAMLPLVSNA